ncbi:MAG: N-acetylmuramoyl-L-alanine amidase [Verrucomicrobia bacterium]|nr:N-acetylmuramoyl-L-alanine amidase [Verrucomicrobiota bacterium]
MTPICRRCFLVALAACLLAADAGAAVLKSRRFEGGEYVLISDIAYYYHLGRNTSNDRETVSYRDLVAKADRREITLNGIQHWLSAPIHFYQGKLWMSATDVLKTVDPVLRQGRVAKPLAVRTIVLDPGHGGNESGATTRRSVEKTLVLDLAKRLQQQLEARGLRVSLTRTTDRLLSLESRPAFAAQKNADLFVSLHLNSGGNASGIETFCLTPAKAVSTAAAFRGWQATRDQNSYRGNRHDEQNIWLAHCIQKSLIRSTAAHDRGVRRARFVVIRDAPCPAVLVEAGFLSNATEERKLLTADYRNRLAKAIADGILAYKAGVEKK